MRKLVLAAMLVIASAATLTAQQSAPPTAAPPTLPPPGSLTTPPAAPNPLAPPAPVVPRSDTEVAPQPPGTAPETGEVRIPQLDGPSEITLEAKPVLMLKGQSSWDDGFDSLTEAFRKLADEAKRLNLGTVGRPQAAFTATDDFGFKFEAMLTLGAEPTAPLARLGAGFEVAKSPTGRTLKFTHRGAYDDIDTTYEAITAYLDEKGLKARDIFVEEYMNDPKNSEDASLEMNIYVLVE